MIVDGVRRLFDLELGGRSARSVGEGEEEGGGGAGKLAPLEPATPGHVCVATEYTSTRSLPNEMHVC